MATAAKSSTGQSSSSSPSSSASASAFNEGGEDIDIIAKQISDHAEAIYQTWKARGLAPTEILNCHSGNSNTFDKTLTPTPSTAQLLQLSPLSSSSSSSSSSLSSQTIYHHRISNKNNPVSTSLLSSPSSPSSSTPSTLVSQQQQQQSASASSSSSSPPNTSPSAAAAAVAVVSELFAQTPEMSNNNLEKLVSSFVNEDKARQQAASRKSSTTNILTSGTIKDALKKFESNDRPTAKLKPIFLRNSSPQPQSTGAITNHHHQLSQQSQQQQQQQQLQQQLQQQQQQQQQQSQRCQSTSPINNEKKSILIKLDKNVPDVLMNTIDQTDNNAISSRQQQITNTVTITKKPETPVKPANLLKHTPTWPLKNRLSSNDLQQQQQQITKIKSSENQHNNDCDELKTNNLIDGSGGIRNNKSSQKIVNNINNSKSGKINNSQNNSSSSSGNSNSGSSGSSIMDEVLLEEERLINALKMGTVLNNDSGSKSGVGSENIKIINESNEVNWNKSTISTLKTPSISSAVSANSTATSIINNSSDAISGGNSSSGGEYSSASDISTIIQPLKKTKQLRPRNDAAVPHPETNKHSTAAIAARTAHSIPAVRPFLTRGSVAERVLMFEKCPEAKALRAIPKEPAKLSAKPLPSQPVESHTTLQRHVRSNTKNIFIPRFHFPFGKPVLSITIEQTLQRLQAAFDSFPNKQASKENFINILKICSLPLYWRMPLYSCAQLTPTGLCDGRKFIEFWKTMSAFCHDPTARFMFVLSHGQRSRPFILPEDLISLVQDVVDTHPGLAFLKEATEFHSRYVHTVIARIFYSINRSWSGRITLPELRKSNLLQVLQLLEEEEDINQVMAYFSYEHFYVIYCKFWELDRDHDLFIDQNDLARHNDHALSTRIIERIFSGCVTKRNKNRQTPTAGIPNKMSYTEFVWFLISEEDKTHPTAVEYWFRCMDLDGDGVLSMYELEYFYEEQQHRMESIGIETLPFEDCLCQMLDLIKPKRIGFITLGDLKRCKMTPIFFDTFFNLEKFMEHEQRDPFASQRDQDDMSDWDRYAAQEYELLVAEEGSDMQCSYDEEDEYDTNLDILESQLDDCMLNIINEW